MAITHKLPELVLGAAVHRARGGVWTLGVQIDRVAGDQMDGPPETAAPPVVGAEGLVARLATHVVTEWDVRHEQLGHRVEVLGVDEPRVLAGKLPDRLAGLEQVEAREEAGSR
jgi:hypothetical protein